MRPIAVITPDQAAGGVAAIRAYKYSRAHVCIRQSSVGGNFAYSSAGFSVCVKGP